MPSFYYKFIASVLHDEASKQRLSSQAETLLHGAGGVAVPEEPATALQSPIPLCIFVLTGGTEREAMRIIENAQMIQRKLPVILLAHQQQNSLPAALEILARIRQLGGAGIIIQTDDQGQIDTATLHDSLAVSSTMQQLQHTRIGVVGKPSDWLVASSQGPETVRAAWGPELVDIPFDELMNTIQKLRIAGYQDTMAVDFIRQAEFFTEAGQQDLQKSMDIYHALKKLVADYRLDALTLRCFDLVLKDRSTGCLALSALFDEGIDAGCEGDIPSILALRWLRLLTGRIGWMANPSKIIIGSAAGGETGSDTPMAEMLIAHCTTARSILSSYGLRSHFESGLGVAITGIVPQGTVTLVRIGGSSLDQLWYSLALVRQSPRHEGLCRTQAVVSLPADKARELLTHPLGNHLVMIQGDWTRRIEAYVTMRGRGPHRREEHG